MGTHDDTELALALLATGTLTSLLIGGFIFWLYWSDRKKRSAPSKNNGNGRAKKKINSSVKRSRLK